MKEDGAWVGLILHDLLKATVLSGLEGGDLFIGFWIFICEYLRRKKLTTKSSGFCRNDRVGRHLSREKYLLCTQLPFEEDDCSSNSSTSLSFKNNTRR